MLFALNDNPDVSAAGGGAHWSLLAWHTHSRTFRHYDSASGLNTWHARRLAAAAAVLVGTAPQGHSGNDGPSQAPEVVEGCNSPQQRNSYDCGMFVLLVAEQLAIWQAQQGGPSQHDATGAGADIAAWEEQELPCLLPSPSVAEGRRRLLGITESKMRGQLQQKSTDPTAH